MQFDYDQEMTTSNDFESDVLQRLQRIENVLMSLSAQNDLVQELIRKEMRSSPMVEKEQKPLSFMIVTVQNPDSVPFCIRISGRTYDIRDRIKQLGGVWKGEIKAWEISYTPEIYHDVLAFLQSHTSDIKEESITEKFLGINSI